MTKIIDEESRNICINDPTYTRGIVYISGSYIEFGWFKKSPKNILIFLEEEYDANVYIGISKDKLDGLLWSNKKGYYILSQYLHREEIMYHTLVKGQGSFPYIFPKKYEAADNFYLFNNKQTILEDVKYPLADHLKYTFGLEFETSMGYVPQEICFRDGLIPLRDGSISGIEYSSVVLEGNSGLNLLKQELDTLKKYTEFNKECALHIHMGGYPVDTTSIYALYGLWYAIERNLLHENYVPNATFNTSHYKDNGKNYCKLLESRCTNFTSLFYFLTGRKYMGSLTQPHPSDIEKRAKWNIKTRYYSLNLINMVCYSGPKTVEFRFLRPTFNYRKITLWLYILNGVLLYAEKIAKEWKDNGNCSTKDMLEWILEEKSSSLIPMLKEVYDNTTVEYLKHELTLLQCAVRNQHSNGDICGRDIQIEDSIFNSDIN